MQNQFSTTSPRRPLLAGARLAVAVLSLGTLSACAVEPPAGPTVPVAPGDHKTLDEFSQDDATCRQFAEQRTGISPGNSAAQSGVASAAIGTLVGAAVGALIGTAAGNPAVGAAIGGGAGLLTGTAAGVNNSQISAGNVQQRYDLAYEQCMQTTGNKTALAQSMPPAGAAPAPGYPAPGYPAPAPAPYPPAYYYPAPAYYYPPPAYYYPPPYYYYPRPCCYWGPGIGVGATFIFHGGGGYHHHHH